MATLLSLGIFWTFYGILGLCGIQRIPSEYKNKAWTKQYIRSCGIGWLMIGVPWILLYAALSRHPVSPPVMALLIVLLALPASIFSFCIEKKYKAKCAEGKDLERDIP